MSALENLWNLGVGFRNSRVAITNAALEEAFAAGGAEQRDRVQAQIIARIKFLRTRRINRIARFIGFTVLFFTVTNFASSVMFAANFASFSTLLNGVTLAAFFIFFSFRAKMDWRKYSILLAVLGILTAVTLIFTLMQNSANGMGMGMGTLSSIATLLLIAAAWGIPALIRKSKADRASDRAAALDSISDSSTSVSDVVAAGKKVARIPQVVGSVAILLVIIIAIAALAGGRNDDTVPTAVETSSNSAVPAVEAPVATQAPVMPQATATPLPANVNERVPGEYFGYVRKISPALEDMGKNAILKAVRPVCVNIVNEGKSVDEAAINLSTTGAFDSSLTLADYIAVAELTNTYACPSFKAGV